MSRRRTVLTRLQLFSDLRLVLDAMKNFALLEIGRLTRTQRFRHRLLDVIIDVARQSAEYFPPRVPSAMEDLFVVIGSERGFCGDFNQKLVTVYNRVRASNATATFIVVGTALATKIEADERVTILPGPITADEIDAVLVALVREVDRWQRANPSANSIAVIAGDSESVSVDAILPFEPPAGSPSRLPALNLSPAVFVRRFIDQYLDVKLHDAFATSLLAENRARLQHMTSAIARVDENLGDLERRSRRLRQEEITQEVETLLLAAGTAGNDYFANERHPRRLTT